MPFASSVCKPPSSDECLPRVCWHVPLLRSLFLLSSPWRADSPVLGLP
jgi:hypothetical protein